MQMNALQDFLETNCPEACKNVDLFAVARDIKTSTKKNQAKPINGRHLPLVNFLLDGECCLDRLYGGYYNDWVCGGQWPRMLEFISQLSQTLKRNSIRIRIVLNGTNELSRKDEWIQQQLNDRQKINNILSHVLVKATPPPKVWWIPPICLKSCLRLALYYLKFETNSTFDNHFQEAMKIYFENGFQGLIADNPEYIVFNPERYFSSKNLKLTFKGSYETKEFVLPKLVNVLDIDPTRLGLLLALAGNFMLTKDELAPFHNTLLSNSKQSNLLLCLAKFVQSFEEPENLDRIGNQIFGLAGQHLTNKFKNCVEYYRLANNLSKTKGGYDGDAPCNSAYPEKEELVSNFSSLALGKEGNDVGHDGDTSAKGNKTTTKGKASEESKLAKVCPELMAVCRSRHGDSLMHPWIYHVFTKGEIRVPVFLEEEVPTDLPPIASLYQPLRAIIYGILSDVQHRKKKPIVVREWLYSRANPYQKPELVTAMPLSNPIPKLYQLWLGGSEFKVSRMNAFLGCMRSENHLMKDRNHVPEHLLLFCCILRYMLTENRPILSRQELEAFLIQAVDPDLQNTDKTQKVEIPIITTRGIQIAAMFMAGVEHAILANDACGAPIQPIHCFPWMFFNGKLFQLKLHKIMCNNNLIALCNGQIDQVSKVEFLRRAILEGLNPAFSHPSMLPPPGAPPTRPSYNPRVLPPRPRMMARGGQLEVAGVVVGSWGANYGRGGGPRFPAPARGVGRGRTRGGGAAQTKQNKQPGARKGKMGNGKNTNGGTPSANNASSNQDPGFYMDVPGMGRGLSIENDRGSLNVLPNNEGGGMSMWEE